MIPRIIHQSWTGKPMPEHLFKLHERMQEVNPEFDVWLWNEASVNDYLCEPWQREHATRAGESNLIRLYALRKYGGIWVDLDFVAIRSFSELIEDRKRAFVAKQGDGVFCNACMGAVPEHPWIVGMLENYGDQRKKDAAWGCHIIKHHLTPDVVILPTDTCYPYNWDEEPCPPTQNTVAMHLWEKSWIS